MLRPSSDCVKLGSTFKYLLEWLIMKGTRLNGVYDDSQTKPYQK